MKKTIALILLLALSLSFFACKKETEETTAPSEPDTPAVTEDAGPTVDEMSPQRMDAVQPRSFPATYGEIDRGGFTEISAADALTDKFETSHIFRDGDTEYYELKDGKAFGIFPVGEDYGSVYYDADGKIVYFGVEPYGWFYADGKEDYRTFSYPLPNGNTILTFYEPDGRRFAIYANNEYFDNNLDLLTDEEQVALVKRVTYALAVLG